MPLLEARTRESEIRWAPRQVMIVPDPMPLQNGDHLTREEFERRYEAMPHIKKAELVEGVVYMPSPVSNTHSWAHGQVMGWLAVYCAATPGVKLNGNVTVRLDENNEVQPDALLRLEPEAGGHSRISGDDYIEGPPELIAEVAASSASYDLYEKMNVYRRNGVQEYLVWQAYKNHLDWFQLSEGKYVPLSPDANGVIRSRVFPGLHLSVTALLKDDLARVLAVLQEGLKTEEHAAFVQQLNLASGNVSFQ